MHHDILLTIYIEYCRTRITNAPLYPLPIVNRHLWNKYSNTNTVKVISQFCDVYYNIDYHDKYFHDISWCVFAVSPDPIGRTLA